jgi:hypothetical protein
MKKLILTEATLTNSGAGRRNECRHYTEWQIKEGAKILWRSKAFGFRAEAEQVFQQMQKERGEA